VDINQCFETLRESEQLEAGNEWYCPNCKEHKQANK
jgi:ubiquitin C-terminal hydrolase